MKIDNTLAAIVTGGASGLGLASVRALRDAGVKVAIFDLNEADGAKYAAETGATFHKVDIMSEDSVLAGFEAARAVQGQERILVHCAMVAGGGKTVGYDKTTGGYKRAPTEAFERGMLGIAVARDLMDLGIRVNAILPGTFATPPMLNMKDRAPAVFAGLEASVPFPKRLGKPEEFGSLVLELVRNCYFNGQLLRLDGAIRMPPK